MVYDSYHGFPLMMNQMLIFGVVTRIGNGLAVGLDGEAEKGQERLTFVQIPQNLTRFFELIRKDKVMFVPIEEIVREFLPRLFRNVEIVSANLFRITRNGDFTLEESDDIDSDFIKEIQVGLKTRKRGRVVRVEVEPNASPVLMDVLRERWNIDNGNMFVINSLIDMKGLWQIVRHPNFRGKGGQDAGPGAAPEPARRRGGQPVRVPQNPRRAAAPPLQQHRAHGAAAGAGRRRPARAGH